MAASITSTTFQPDPTFTSPITTAPLTTQIALAASCLDPSNLWVVETSCYLTAPQSLIYGYSDGPSGVGNNPEWLTCYETNFGHPDWVWSNPACGFGAAPATTVETTTTATNGQVVTTQEVVYYDGCAPGYTAAASSSGPAYLPYTWSTSGWYDISTYETTCCPTFVYPPAVSYADILSVDAGRFT